MPAAGSGGADGPAPWSGGAGLPLPAAAVLPHSGALCLLDTLITADADHAVCRATVRRDGLFDRDGRAPAALGLEYMAQAVGCYSGYQARGRGAAPRIGLLLGSRRFNTSAAAFRCGQELTVVARRAVAMASGLASFECTLRGEGIEQRAMLSVYEPPNGDELLDALLQ